MFLSSHPSEIGREPCLALNEPDDKRKDEKTLRSVPYSTWNCNLRNVRASHPESPLDADQSRHMETDA